MNVILQRIIIIAIMLFIIGLVLGVSVGILICERIDKKCVTKQITVADKKN